VSLQRLKLEEVVYTIPWRTICVAVRNSGHNDLKGERWFTSLGCNGSAGSTRSIERLMLRWQRVSW